MSADSMYILVEMTPVDDDPFSAQVAGISRVIRTYESRERADEDLELLRVVAPVATYRVLDVPHIER
jgi:hypothetical protein